MVTVFQTDGAESKYFVSSGTVTVNADSSVQILAEEVRAPDADIPTHRRLGADTSCKAYPLSELDINAARSGLDQYTAKLSSSNEAEKAEAEIGVEVHTAMIKALEQ